MKLRFLLAALLLLPSLGFAADQSTANLMVDYELDATTITYCKVTGNQGMTFAAGGISGKYKITTSGSSATTTEVTTGNNPFLEIGVGDVLVVDFGTGPAGVLRRVVTAKASSASLTVNSAWDLSATGGYSFVWYKTTCGTTATSGWVSVDGFDQFSITFQLDQVDVTGGIDVRIECRGSGLSALPVQVFPGCASGSCSTVQNYITAGVASRTTVVFTEPWSECRMGVLIHTSDDGADTTTHAEQLTGYITGFKQTR